MRDVTLNKTDVLKTMKENRAKHENIYKEACIGFLAEVQKIMSSRQNDAAKIREIDELESPVSYLGHYDEVIEMLAMSIDDKVVLSHSDFKQYMMDRWNWQDSFLNSNAKYSSTANSMKG